MLVACATDRRFVELSAVMLRSFVANAELPQAEFIVFEEHLRESDRHLIRASAAPHKVRFVDLEESKPLIGNLPVRRHWPTANYGRLIVPDLIPDCGSLLYLDCDTIINRSLRDLAELDFQGHAVAAVPGQNLEWRHEANHRLGRPTEWPFFNAGVLMIDLDAWRRQGLTGKILDWIACNRDRIVGLSQDPLNAAVGDQWTKLDQSYNFQGKTLRDSAAFAHVHIIHFTGSTKPDHEGCRHGATQFYLAHRQHTPWKNRPLISRRLRKLRRFLDNMRFAAKKIQKLNPTRHFAGD
jgi:lipopolysaccharide biosynthesis glycosyltransferase